MTEQELAARCRSGDRVALKLLYDRYAGWMMGISMRYTGNEHDSRDILHDSFVKIFGSIDRFDYRGMGSLGAWLGRVVVNTALSFLKRKENISVTDEDRFKQELTDGNDENEDHEKLYRAVSDEMIIRCIGELPVRLRAVFNLYMFEDRPHSDIARELGIKESASRVRLHRAKTLMAEAIRREIEKTEA